MRTKISDILPLIIGKEIILVGENHGVVENAEFIESLITSLKKTMKISAIGFEYPVFLYEDFLGAVLDNSLDKIISHPGIQMVTEDGRFSPSHFKLFVRLKSLGIPFFFFDSGDGKWDIRDKKMYENIERKIPALTDGILILVAGNIHTSLTQLTIDNKKYKPLGSYFDSKKLLHIKLFYHSGEFFNFKRQTFDRLEEPIDKVDSNQVYYLVPHATPTK